MKNTHVTPSRATGTPSTGNSKPLANMPANNNGTFPYNTGTTHKSAFGQGVSAKAGNTGAKQTKSGGANMSANNITDNKVVLGHTKHGVGQVPGYLRSK